MSKEENIQQELVKQFPFLEGKFKIQRERRIFVEVLEVNFLKIFGYAAEQLKFGFLNTITGLDEGANLSFIYHLSGENGIILNIKVSVPKENPVILTVTHYFPAATLYERELVDLLGAKVQGLPEDKRYPLPDDWPIGEYPLRKDWKKDTLHPEVK